VIVSGSPPFFINVFEEKPFMANLSFNLISETIVAMLVKISLFFSTTRYKKYLKSVVLLLHSRNKYISFGCRLYETSLYFLAIANQHILFDIILAFCNIFSYLVGEFVTNNH